MKIRLRNRKWRIKVGRLDKNTLGECHHDKRKIIISPKAKGRLTLDTLIHESLHACFPDMGEGAVDEVARDIAEVLWKVGYRVPKDK
jgi:hypothetical protein